MLFDLTSIKLPTLSNKKFLLNELQKRNLTFEDVTELNISGCQMEDLLGIDIFVNLKVLNASNNKISHIDPIVSLDLSVIKLDHNHLEDLYVKELSNGKIVLSSDIDNEYTETFLGLGFNYSKSLFNKDNSIQPLEFVDLSHNNIKFFRSLTKNKIDVKLINLSNNNISDFSGLSSLYGFRSLNLSNNYLLDIKHLENVGFSYNCKVFIQSTPLQNEHLLTKLLNEHKGMVIEHETDNVQHERLLNPYNIHVNNLKNKKFVTTEGEFADFIYEGELYPSELLTPRYTNSFNIQSDENIKDKTSDSISHLETQSTIDYYENKPPSISSSQNESEDQYVMNQYTHVKRGESESLPKKGGSKFVNDLNELDFLISSMELCKKIDVWSDDIKNTLYNDLRDQYL